MADIISDAEIAQLLGERKFLPDNYRRALHLVAGDGHRRADLEIAGERKNRFVVILRQAERDWYNFSAILTFLRPDTGQPFRLRRYNGLGHRHQNKIERGPVFMDYHVHQATERYQRAHFAEEQYAEISDRYADLSGAFRCMIEDCNIVVPPGDQIEIFDWRLT